MLRELLEIVEHEAHDLAEIFRFLRHRGKPHLVSEFTVGDARIKGEHMIFTMNPVNADGTPATVTDVISPVLADGKTPSKATLSSLVATSTDPTVFTVAANPAVPNGLILTSVNLKGGTATLQYTALATEPDGTTTETIHGSDTIILAVPPPAPAALLISTFGIPSSAPPPPPPPPTPAVAK